jgi:hypothetical protein
MYDYSVSINHHFNGNNVGVYHNTFDSFKILKLKKRYISNNSMVMQAYHQVDFYFIANMMLTIVKSEISIKIVTMQTTICRDFLYDISYKSLG